MLYNYYKFWNKQCALISVYAILEFIHKEYNLYYIKITDW